MRSTVINTSKEMMCYSDYPIPKEYPNFMHNTHVWQYFKDYAEHFGLKKYIHYNVEVVMVTRTPDFAETGKWNLELVDHKSGKEWSEVFDAVLVCTGHHAEKNEPSFPGLSDFKGEVLHSHDYREPSRYVGKRILIIGIGNSGGDMAVELSRCGQVFLSTRRGTWIWNRLGRAGGMPVDIAAIRRVTFSMLPYLPASLVNAVLKKAINSHLDHDLYSLTPDYPPQAQHPMVNDDLGNRIACGSVKIKADVKRFTATGVEFVDGTFEDSIDLVVLATGYIFGFPFIEKKVIDVKENRLPFYKYMFPPDLEHKTLAVIGCIQPLGAIMPISELQCRLATRVFKGDVKLPSATEMWKDIRMKEAAMAQRYVKTQRHTVQVDYIPFMDELAELNGCKPDVGKSCAIADPRLERNMYRLMGPGKWEGAREAIMTTMDRVQFPLATRPLPVPAEKGGMRALLLRIFVVVILMLIVRLVFL
nr:hypothetical protein BaRGS_005689 [Batillaria attramentaria]